MDYELSCKTYRLPLAIPLRTAHGPWMERAGAVVRLESGDGRVGYGEVAPVPWFGTETPAQAEAVLRRLTGRVTDEALDAVPARFGCVRFALESARRADGVGEALQRLPVAALLPAGRDALEVLPAKLEAGFLVFKWKVGVGEVNDELAILDDVLAALPGFGRLRLDANGAWPRRLARRWCERCAERPVEYVEQPVNPDDEDTLLGLAHEYPVKIALDESTVHFDDIRRWHVHGWPGVFVVKPALAGPMAELRRLVDELVLDVVLTSCLETMVARRTIVAELLRGNLTKRAVGLGVGPVFGRRALDGPPMGPVVDGDWLAAAKPEDTWNDLS